MDRFILKNGKELIIRKANLEDAKKLAQYKTIVCSESDFLTYGENEVKITAEKEGRDIEEINNKNNSIIAVAILDDEIVGSIVFKTPNKIRLQHKGDMGITIRKDYWRLGIGSLLMGYLINWAKKTEIIKKINLRVRADNENAINLYKKYGFKKEGVISRDFCVNGIFYDSIFMGLEID